MILADPVEKRHYLGSLFLVGGDAASTPTQRNCRANPSTCSEDIQSSQTLKGSWLSMPSSNLTQQTSVNRNLGLQSVLQPLCAQLSAKNPLPHCKEL
jgi:hypothetical protein